MVYNIPIHSGFDITPNFFKQLMQIDNVQYIKDSTADLVRIQELLSIGANVFNGRSHRVFCFGSRMPWMCVGSSQCHAEGVCRAL
jgi:4-hydroxy-tetrahydrodipicolinate synthase